MTTVILHLAERAFAGAGVPVAVMVDVLNCGSRDRLRPCLAGGLAGKGEFHIGRGESSV